ncbi:MAG TPA: diguanylate cyclase [Kofleriaceae bacterium]|nr:diguanylate cyclase [Kofleriaceae bacterium]
MPELIVLDVDGQRSEQMRRRLAAAYPQAPVVAVNHGEYELTLETAFAVLRTTRRRRTDREKRLTARMRRLEQSNDELMRSACIDLLTGVANRRHFDDLLGTEWKRAARGGAALSLVMLDLDYFHALNERYGHPGGDACLRRVADALVRVLRRPSDIVARYGGEEFVALLPDTDAAGACVVAERLRAQVEGLQVPHAGSACSAVVTLSAGVATDRPGLERSCRTLVGAADRALFRAKQEGRNRVCADTGPAGPIVVCRPNRPPGPFVFAEPFLAGCMPRLLAATRSGVGSTRDRADLDRAAAMSRELRRVGAKLGFEVLTELGCRLELAVRGGDHDRVRQVLDEVAWYLDHVQVVYQRPAARGSVSPETGKLAHTSTRS